MNIAVDTHHHVVPPFYVEEMTRMGLPKVASLSYPKWSPKKSLNMMDAVGIQRALLSLSTPGVDSAGDPAGLAKDINDYLASVKKRYPERFGAFGALPMDDPDKASAEALRVLDDLDFEGVTMLSNCRGRYPGESRYEDLFRALDARSARVFLHPTNPPDPLHQGLVSAFYGWFVDTSKAVWSLEQSEIFQRYPKIRFFLGHGGGAYPLIRDIVERRGALVCDTAKVAEPVTMKTLFEGFGEDRMIFGSDFPWAKKAAYWKTRIQDCWAGWPGRIEKMFQYNASAWGMAEKGA